MPRQYRRPVTKACERCGNPFSAPAFRADKAHYCSRRCHYAPGPPEGLAVAFWEKVDQPPEGCWIRRVRKERQGYGQFRYAKHWYANHRLAYELTYGPVPEGMEICHTCDNPPCCRPSHLFLGTAVENTQDMMQKDRGARGSRNGNARLNEQQVQEIRARHASGEAQAKLAREFGTDRALIYTIVHRKSWKHVA